MLEGQTIMQIDKISSSPLNTHTTIYHSNGLPVTFKSQRRIQLPEKLEAKITNVQFQPMSLVEISPQPDLKEVKQSSVLLPSKIIK